MSIPDFQKLMLPFLKITGDEHVHHVDEMIGLLAQQFGLTEEERKEMLPTGIQAKFDNAVRWVRIHLGKARLVESTGREKFCITRRGLEVLQSNPSEITVNFLLQFPEYVEFRNPSRHHTRSDRETF